MTTANPYAAPNAADIGTNSSAPTYQPKIFSLSGRIGRARYLAYGMAIYLIVAVAAAAVGVAAAAVGQSDVVGMAILGLMYIGIMVFAFALVVRRLNDVNQSGWLSLLMLVPLVNIGFGLYIMCARGTAGPNNYGPAPVPNTGGVIAAALALPIIGLIGILAAIALPAYQQYVERAQAAQTQQLD